MSTWPGKFVIGITGNIGTGKSVVRKMLEHLGAYGIDADALGHRAIAKGAPGYQPLVDTFGQWILAPNGEIDRRKLGRLAFADPEIMQQLEAIIHPLVGQAVDWLVRRSPKTVIAIEAIKLLESDLRKHCDSIWVVTAPPEKQLERLLKKRGMSRAEAEQRIKAQGSPSAKIAAADVVIYNDGSFEKTWEQVKKAWKLVVPQKAEGTRPITLAVQRSEVLKAGAQEKPATVPLKVKKAGPKQAGEIAAFLKKATGKEVSRAEVLAAFGEKAYLLLYRGDEMVGLLGWQVENLVSRINEFHLLPDVPLAAAASLMLTEMERGSKELQCEAALFFLPPAMAKQTALWKQLGYIPRKPESLGMRAWQEAARESQPPGTVLLFKQLRQDRVLQPL